MRRGFAVTDGAGELMQAKSVAGKARAVGPRVAEAGRACRNAK